MNLTLDRLKSLLRYDPQEGTFTRAAPGRRVRVGDRAGHLNRDGYRYVRVDGLRYGEHRLAWFYMTGEWPGDDIDHRDLHKSNNRFGNLRCATRSQNMHNTEAPSHNTSGCKGVCFDVSTQKWLAYTFVDGRFHNFGRYLLKDEAAAAHAAGMQRLFGEFARATHASTAGNSDNLIEPRHADGIASQRTPQHCKEAPNPGNPLSKPSGQLRDAAVVTTSATSQGASR